MTKELFEQIKKEYGHYASWAVWMDEGSTPKSNMGSEVFDDKKTIESLHTKYVLVALNISRAIDKQFGNFHPNYSAATDYKTRYALKGTPFWGAYMTDIIKDFEEVVSGKMIKYLKEHPNFEKQNIETFLAELDFIGAENPVLVAIGKDSYRILQRNLGQRFQIICIPHYANYSSRDIYREQVLEVIK